MMHGIHVTLTRCNMMHGTHVTLTHCNMMHGTQNVTLKFTIHSFVATKPDTGEHMAIPLDGLQTP